MFVRCPLCEKNYDSRPGSVHPCIGGQTEYLGEGNLLSSQQIRIAALNAAVPAWAHKCQMTMHADFKPVDLWEIVAAFEEYIKTGERK